MEPVREFLDDLKQPGQVQGHFLGLLNILIGRRIQKEGGNLVSAGLSWRAVAAWLKKVRWDKEAVRELGFDPATLPPRDRQRFWYTAIVQARVDSSEATEAGDRLAIALKSRGYVIGASPRGTS